MNLHRQMAKEFENFVLPVLGEMESRYKRNHENSQFIQT
jgi:hypothetical protein